MMKKENEPASALGGGSGTFAGVRCVDGMATVKGAAEKAWASAAAPWRGAAMQTRSGSRDRRCGEGKGSRHATVTVPLQTP